MNVLFITLDQFRGDSYGAAGHPLVQTPTLDRIAREGVRLIAPLLPGRAVLTGSRRDLHRHLPDEQSGRRQRDAAAARDSTTSPTSRVAPAIDPTLFGYTDQGVDPADAEGIDDPRLDSYDGVLPGLSVGLYLPESQAGWIQHLRAKGYDVPYGWEVAARGEPDRPAELSLSGFLTTRFLEWLAYPGERMVRPPQLPASPSAVRRGRGVLSDVRPRRRRDADRAGAAPSSATRSTTRPWASRRAPRRRDPDQMRALKAQYYGMISEVDTPTRASGCARSKSAASGRTRSSSSPPTTASSWATTDSRRSWASSPRVTTSSDCGAIPTRATPDEWSRASARTWTCYRRSPTCLSLDEPAQCDGRSLDAAARGRRRAVAHAPRTTSGTTASISSATSPTTGRRTAACRSRISPRRSVTTSGTCSSPTGRSDASTSLADPTWRTECRDAERIMRGAQEQLVWRQEHLRRDLTDMLLRPESTGSVARPVSRTWRFATVAS